MGQGDREVSRVLLTGAGRQAFPSLSSLGWWPGTFLLPTGDSGGVVAC